ncbi:MAG: DUF2235 domain-containing protein [Methylocella sp.]
MADPSRNKKIVVFSDGTGNSSAKAQKTNVWRMFQALDHTNVDQFAKYDDGVGTSSIRPLAVMGGVIGWGLKRNVLDLYRFVCLNYPNQAGNQKIAIAEKDRPDIYAFGFSRGAFTIRVLIDFIATEGLVTYRSEAELYRNAASAYRHYRSKNFPSWSPFVLVMRGLRDALLWGKDRYHEVAARTKAAERFGFPIKFVGLWDTVDAYGMPIAELKQGIDWVLWPMLFGDNLKLSPVVERACHALSLDEERMTFHPVLGDDVGESKMVEEGKVAAGRLTRVWFAGAHSNVGGGYPEDQLSLVSLEWMMGEAMANGLALDSNAVAQVSATKSPYARLYDSRSGLAAYYRYAPRQIEVKTDSVGNPILPIVHGSVVMRMASGSNDYVPISLPPEFWVLAPDGELLPMEGQSQSLKIDMTKKRRASTPLAMKTFDAILDEKTKLTAAIEKLARPDQEALRLVWDTVFWRRCLYVLTIGLTGIFAAYPWIDRILMEIAHAPVGSNPHAGPDPDRWDEWLHLLDDGLRWEISYLVDLVSGVIPTYARPWTKAIERNPVELTLIIASILLSLWGSALLRGRIHDRSVLAWHKNFPEHKQHYANWLTTSLEGWRNVVLLALLVATIGLVLTLLLGAGGLIEVEFGTLLGILVVVLAVLLALRNFRAKGPSQSIFWLPLARRLRTNFLLRGVDRLLFKGAVPIAFALLIVAAGGVIVNRALFDGMYNAGVFCKGSLDAIASKTEKTGKNEGFTTDHMCWPTGLVLQEGRHYRITLTTPGDWFNRTTRADVAGFPATNFLYWVITPLKRWWWQDWFKPIATIGWIGSDDYVLQPTEPFERYRYPACPQIERATKGILFAKIKDDVARDLLKCAPTPDNRKSLVTVIEARSTGELFLYVNDAVLMLPPWNEFYRNNSGTGSVTVERITSQP